MLRQTLLGHLRSTVTIFQRSVRWLIRLCHICQVRAMDEGEDSNAGGKRDFY